MKILISAYACNPYVGSEPGVGWAAVRRIARKHDVVVLTGGRARHDLKRARKEGLIPENVRFVHLEEVAEFHPNRFLARLQNWMRYRAFNQRVLAEAVKLHEREAFDLCHQVTIAGWRMPSPLWQLPIPFVWGPIGGAGEIPGPFRTMLSPSARLFERMRDANTAWVSRSRVFRQCAQHASHIFAANQETLEFLKPFRHGGPITRLPIASIPTEKAEKFSRAPRAPDPSQPLRLFAGGNMEGRKGGSLALKALARLKQQGADFHYTIGGGGPDIPALKTLAQSLGIAEQVTFHDGFSGDDYLQALWDSDVYFLPSFRESTPVTLLEACLAGCYPVVADTSAQGEIVGLTGGSAVPVETVDGLVQGMAKALWWCHTHRDEMAATGREAAARIAKEFSADLYDQALDEVYSAACEHSEQMDGSDLRLSD